MPPGKPVVTTCEPVAGEPNWQAPLAALRQWLELGKHARAAVNIIISDCFVRYALIPWSEEVQKPVEMAALSNIHFEELFGTSAKDWEIQTDFDNYGKAGIGCAVDKAFIASLKGLLAIHKVQITSLQPYFMRAFNLWRSQIKHDALFAIVESGQCVLASFKKDAWHSVRIVRLGENPEAALAVLSEREILLQGLGNETAIYLHTLQAIEMTQFQKKSNMTLLEIPLATRGHLAAQPTSWCGIL